MLTKGFYYFLMIGELGILGLIMAGIVLKVKRIIHLHAVQIDDQDCEHFVSESDHPAVLRDAGVFTHPDVSPKQLGARSLQTSTLPN